MPKSPGMKNTLCAHIVAIGVVVFIVVIVLIIVNVIGVIVIAIAATIHVKSVIVTLVLINAGDVMNHIVSTAVLNDMSSNKENKHNNIF